ncbi:hypothetical protein, partial [Cupriavidus basilensis]|uniref:hypothetical protein n=1 Tax=Cupriavidus basilensis TaxID=68895 RepID=UPI0023E815B4
GHQSTPAPDGWLLPDAVHAADTAPAWPEAWIPVRRFLSEAGGRGVAGKKAQGFPTPECPENQTGSERVFNAQ